MKGLRTFKDISSLKESLLNVFINQVNIEEDISWSCKWIDCHHENCYKTQLDKKNDCSCFFAIGLSVH